MTRPLALPELPPGVIDVFVFRQVARSGFWHVGGVGRGREWAGVVGVDHEAADRELVPAVGEVLVRASTEPAHWFGPYWSSQLVAARTEPDELVVFGGESMVADLDGSSHDVWFADALSFGHAIREVAPAKRLADELRVLHAVRDVALLTTGTVAEVALGVAERLRASMSCEVGALHLRDRDELAVDADSDIDVDRVALHALVRDLDPDGPLAIVQDARKDERLRAAVPGARASMTVRVGAGQEHAVVLLLHAGPVPRGFTDLCRGIGTSASTAAAIALQAARHRELRPRCEVPARRDPVTGMPDAAEWREWLQAPCSGLDAVLVVVVAGLDEAIATSGRGFGDQLLRTAADALRAATRDGDLLARIDGPRFGVLLRGADEAVAGRVAERIRLQGLRYGRTIGSELALAVGSAVAIGHDDVGEAAAEAAAAAGADDHDPSPPAPPTQALAAARRALSAPPRDA